jgi:hypothetical protein
MPDFICWHSIYAAEASTQVWLLSLYNDRRSRKQAGSYEVEAGSRSSGNK